MIERSVQARDLSGKDGYRSVDSLDRAHECATEQREHSWLGSFDFPAYAWLARSTAANSTRRTCSTDRVADNAPLRVMCSPGITADHSRSLLLAPTSHGPLVVCLRSKPRPPPLSRPSRIVQSQIRDPRAVQFWDKNHLVAKELRSFVRLEG